MIPPSWNEYRRDDDDELLGYLDAGADGSVQARAILGHPLGTPSSAEDAERLLDALGLGYLAERWLLTISGRAEPIAVQIVEATPTRVVLQNVDLGWDGDYGTRFTLPVPVDQTVLRPERAIAR